MKSNVVICGDCLDELPKIESGSVDLIVIDPPYNISKDTWDKWKSVKEYVEFMGFVFAQCERVLKDNGSFYFFHNDFMQIVELQNWLNQNSKFVFNSMIHWIKPNFRSLSWKNPGEDSNLRSWFNCVEYCLFYTFQDQSGLSTVMLDVNNFSTLRGYFKNLQEFIGLGLKKINERLGHRRAEHCFYWKTTQWDMPTPETYQQLIDMFDIDKWNGFRPYEALRQEYEALRQEYESLRYKHNLDKNHNNIWQSKSSNTGKWHPTEKPLDIISRIINTSSNEGDLILDCLAGSGTTGVACKNLGRNYILIEKEPKYVAICNERLAQGVLNLK